MICPCIKELEEKLITVAQVHDGRVAWPKKADKVVTARLKNIGLLFSSGKCALMIPFTFQWKDANGSYLTKETETSIEASFCPFCGKSTEDKTEQPESKD